MLTNAVVRHFFVVISNFEAQVSAVRHLLRRRHRARSSAVARTPHPVPMTVAGLGRAVRRARTAVPSIAL
jgi:hypothetical protein